MLFIHVCINVEEHLQIIVYSMPAIPDARSMSTTWDGKLERYKKIHIYSTRRVFHGTVTSSAVSVGSADSTNERVSLRSSPERVSRGGRSNSMRDEFPRNSRCTRATEGSADRLGKQEGAVQRALSNP